MKKTKVELSPGGYANYKDISLKKFSGATKIGHCEKWLANLLGLPKEAVHLVYPSGRRGIKSSTLTLLRKSWKQ
jgi:hypothetical protein